MALIREGRFKGQFSGGVADRFTGLITVFAFALLNDLPFFIDYPRLHEVFQAGQGNLSVELNLTSKCGEIQLVVVLLSAYTISTNITYVSYIYLHVFIPTDY